MVLDRHSVGHDGGSEDIIRDILMSSADLSSTSTEMLSRAEAWEVRLELDPARANVLRGLSFPPSARVLEIGSGCGAVTRFLGETVALVDAVERSPTRAALARLRTADLANTEVFVGGLDDIPPEPAYDFVVLGGFDAAGGGSDDEGAYVEFLRRARTLLVPGGTLLVPVDNKIGVKYLAGYPDERTGRPFDSLENYPHGTEARSFALPALTRIFDSAGLAVQPLGVFPDYRSARVVFDFDSLPTVATDLLYQVPNFPSVPRDFQPMALANEGLLWKELVSAGLATEFANSYLIVATVVDQVPAAWPEDQAAVFFSNSRRKEFHATTVVTRAGDSVILNRAFAEVPSSLISRETSRAPYAIGIPFPEVFAAADTVTRKSLLAEWRARCEALVDSTGVPIDAIPQNVVVSGDSSLVFIDIEFRSPDHSVDFLVRRGVLWLGIQLAMTNVPEHWAKYGRVRELVVAIGTLAGLPRSGSWLKSVLVQEAEFQTMVTSFFNGQHAAEAWRAELELLLDRDLHSVPLGFRLNDLYNLALRSLEPVKEQLAEAMQSIEGLERLNQQMSARQLQSAEAHSAAAAESSRAMAESRSELEATRHELAILRNSLGLRTIDFARRRVDALAPWGTHRRGLVERSLVLSLRAVRRLRRPPGLAPATVQSVPFSSTPLVSIVIPIYGKWEYTSRCLASIARWHDGEAIEVVVVDDASPDDSRARLAAIDGVRVVGLDTNVGFTRAANAGIAAATGDYVIMLNNDAEVTSGWLRALLAAAVGDDVGLVGAKLIYPDGRLQEAGGVIFDDANGWNYGKFQDPTLPQFNFRKDVDYCSGAALLITRRLLKITGGFDERYAPAYYEDPDLAFEARAHGLRVIYEPKSVVIHHEGISHGADESIGTKRYQAINRVKFAEKWAGVLSLQQPNAHENVTLGSIRRGARGTIVVVDHMVPRWKEDAGSLRMHRLLISLVEMGYSVIFVPENRDAFEPYTSELQSNGVLVWFGWSDLWAYLREIHSVVTLVMLSRASIASLFIRNVREVLPDVPIVFDTVDLHFLREQRRFERGDAGGKAKGALATRELELALVRSADSTVVVSEYEKSVLDDIVPDARVFVLPTVHHRVSATGRSGREDISFVGSFQHDPNVDALRWFLAEIFPLVRMRLPRARLVVVGKNPPSDVVARATPGVEYLGWVDDLDPIHASSLVSVAPLRYGAGVKGKVGEAWAHGVPVVMTTLATEGMNVEGGVTALVADDAQDFADAVVKLMTDAELWQRVSDAGREHVETTFGPARFRDRLEEIVAHAMAVGDAASESA